MRMKKIKTKVKYFWNTRLTSRMKKNSAIILGGVICLLAGAYILSQQLLYTGVKIKEVYTSVGSTSSRYELFADGILRYGRDGAAYIDYDGVEIWNQAYQISAPIIEVTKGCAVVADSGGNDIAVFDENGLKGQIETTLPIEKVSVSEQGIVAILTKDVETPRVICYDAVGNLLVEHKPSNSTTGYPVDVSLALDGKLMLVTYVQVQGNEIVSNYVFYSFDEMANGGNGATILEEKVAGVIAPETYFPNEDTAVIVNDQGFAIYTGGKNPQLLCETPVGNEINMVFYNDEYIGFVLDGATEYDNELRLYNLDGKQIVSIGYDGYYDHVDIVGREVVLYKDNQCRIFTLNGVERFRGEMGMELKGVYPTRGINNYIVVGKEGIEKVQLTR